MSVTLAVALLALLISVFTLVALVAVYARLRGLESGTVSDLSGYPALVGRPAPAVVRPGPGQRRALVAVVDGDCTLCRALLAGLSALAAGPGAVRAVALTDRVEGVVPGVDVIVDPSARADLFEGYAPTVLAVDGSGTVAARRFVYADTDIAALLDELAGTTAVGA